MKTKTLRFNTWNGFHNMTIKFRREGVFVSACSRSYEIVIKVKEQGDE